MMNTASSIIFAAVGDVHGAMHAMARLLEDWEREHGLRLDFVLQVGDFEPHRDIGDLESASIPQKYRNLGDFADYCTGRASFAWPIYFIGGNHEPYGHLDGFPEGREIAPNCHYLGRVSHTQIRGLSIVGLTGIHSETKYTRRPPLDQIANTKKKLYVYYTEEEVRRAMGYGRPDVLILHEWPRGAIELGQEEATAGRRRAPFPGSVGSMPARQVVDALRPKLIVAGHMHWRHRSSIEPSQFAAMGHIDSGPEALGVFEFRGDGSIVELAGLSRPGP